MPEFRRDPLTDRWVIIAPERSRRPSDFRNVPGSAAAQSRCPFCRGHEADTPATIRQYPASQTGVESKWQVRVVPNQYPAVAALHPTANGPTCHLSRSPAIGVHEVIIESGEHKSSFTELTADEAQFSVIAYRDRILELSQRPDLKYALVFKNNQAAGGATLEHVHSQLLATTWVPNDVQHELDAAVQRFNTNSSCVFCQLVESELADGQRIVWTSERFVVWCPFASRFPYQMVVQPRRHTAHFHESRSGELEELSGLFQLLLRGLENVLAQSAHNYWIHTAPFDIKSPDHYHWHAEIIPRITTQAGYEWGAGSFVNPVAPEAAAEKLRQIVRST